MKSESQTLSDFLYVEPQSNRGRRFVLRPRSQKMTSDSLPIWSGVMSCGTIGANENFTHDLVTHAAGIIGEYDFIVYEFRDSFSAEGIMLDTRFDCYTMSFSAWRDRFLAMSVFNLKGSEHSNNDLVGRTRSALQA